ncbi:MAG: MarP family serine protease [Chloroflexi bacterium]|nr:MAG: MarP family serine protease [Chloroflexota bacterium]
MVDVLDAIIVLLLVLAIGSGWRRGLTWVGLSLLGLLIGLIVGAAVAPAIAKHTAGHHPGTQSLIGTAVFLAVVAVIQGVGTAVGYRARMVTVRSRLASIDTAGGAVLAALGVLVGAWYLGLVFSASPFVTLDQEIRDSAILRGLDDIAPRPPAFLGSLQSLFRGQSFPNPFAGLAPTLLGPVPIPANVDTPGVRAAQQVTSKVLSRGCGVEAGSSWPLGSDYVVTNAHVVAGGQAVSVQAPDGHTYDATVVLFDPNVDVAVLRVPGIGLHALPRTSIDPPRGVTGAVVGYPGGGSEQVVPAAVRGTEQAQGRNIYGDNLVTRDIEVLSAQVIPGNSGGPVVDLQGRVIGMVFAASTVDPNQGYALTMPQISADINAGMGRTAAASTQDCAA